tara:strand:- start:559 stop:843 length:285 start_codon:yes stop_codon:yes gene_type:complete
MKLFKNLLPALGLVFGATLAMAMNVPTMVAEKTATKVWTPDASLPYGYRDITNLEISQDYSCNGTGPECEVEFSNDDPATGIKNVLEAGVFTEM